MKSTIYCFLLMSIAIIFFIALSIIDLSVSFAQGKSKTPVPQKQVSIPPPSEVIKMNQRQNYQPSSHEPPVAPLTEEEIGKYNELIGRIDRDIIISGLKFSFNIFSGAVKQNDKPNTFISPFSVMQALLLTYNGAAGETKTAMEKTFYLENIDSEKLAATNIAFNKLIENIDPKVEMSVANSVWTKTGLAFSEEYLKKNTQIYNAEVKSVDFKSADAVPAINKWVSDKTRGKISPAVERLPENLTVMLINAIYFKGAWTSKFNPDNTRDEDFNAPGGVKKVKMMTQGGSFEYMKNEEFQAIKMYYGARRRVAMYLFLPVSGSGLDKFIADLTYDNWNKWLSSFRELPGAISMPRLKMRYEITLNKLLCALGMGVAFEQGKADFSKMSALAEKLDFFISLVIQKTFVEVNEEGTEAAAVTMVGVEGRGMAQKEPEPFTMIVDRPYFFAIVNNDTGHILFMGAINDPAAE